MPVVGCVHFGVPMRLVLASLLLAGCVPGVSTGNSSSSGSPVDIEQPGGGGSDSGTTTDTASNDTGGWVDTGGSDTGGGGVSGSFVAAGSFAGGISNPDYGDYPCEGDLAFDVDGTSFVGTATCTGSSAGTWNLTFYGDVRGGSIDGTVDAVLDGWDCVIYEDGMASGSVDAEGGYLELSVVSVWTECGYDYNWDFAGAAELIPA